MDLLNIESGKVESVEDSQIQDAIASGKYAPQNAQTFNVISPEGKEGTIQGSELFKSLNSGYSIETPEETKRRLDEQKYGGIGNEILAGGIGALNTATLGLSNMAAEAISPEAGEYIKGLEETNPKSTMTGELVGAVAPAIIPGAEAAPINLLSKLGAGAEELATSTIENRIAKKLVGSVVRGSTEGAVFQAGIDASEDMINNGNTDLTAEHLLSSGLRGAEIGGGLGLGLGITELAGSKAFEQLGDWYDSAMENKTFADKVSEFAQMRAVKSAGGIQSSIKKLSRGGRNQEKVYDLGQWIIDNSAKDLEQVRELKEKAGEQIGKTLTELDNVKPENLKLTGDVDNMMAQSELPIYKTKQGDTAFLDSDVLLKKIDENVLAPLKEEVAVGNEPIIKRIEAEMDKISDKYGGFEYKAKKFGFTDENMKSPEFQKMKDDLAKKMKVGTDSGMTFSEGEELKTAQDKFLKYGAETPPMQEALENIRRTVKNYVEDTAEKVADVSDPKLSEEFKLAKKNYGFAAETEKLMNSKWTREQGNRWASLTDYMTGEAMGGVSALLGGATGHVTVGGLVGLAAGIGSTIAHKTFRENGSYYVAQGANKLAKLLTIERTSNDINSRIGKAIKSLMKESDMATISARKENRESIPIRAGILAIDKLQSKDQEAKRKVSFEKSKQRLANLTNNPQSMINAMTDNLSKIEDVAPKTTASLTNKTLNRIKFLNEKIPKDSINGVFGEKSGPSMEKIIKFQRSERIAKEPLSVLDRLSDGTITKDEVETLQNVYPEIYKQIQTKIYEIMKTSDLPIKTRKSIEMLFGYFPVDRFSILQSSFGEQQQDQQSKPVRLGAMKQQRIVSGEQTKTEKILS